MSREFPCSGGHSCPENCPCLQALLPGLTKEDVKSVATAMGVRFQLSHTMVSDPDPDVLFLYVSELPFHLNQAEYRGGPYNAILYYAGATTPLIWHQYTKASVSKMLDGGRECVVCLDEGAIRISHCPRCHCSMCSICVIKMVLSPEYISQFMNGTADSRVTTPCPQCRAPLEKEAMQNYCTVLDRLDEFTEDQQNVLSWFKSSDPDYEVSTARWKNTADRLKYIQSRSFRKGCRVKLRHLKAQKQWNGKKAVIIGTKTIKNGVIRWPIRLSGNGRSKALMKPCNMFKI